MSDTYSTDDLHDALATILERLHRHAEGTAHRDHPDTIENQRDLVGYIVAARVLLDALNVKVDAPSLREARL